jgi:hypothetical protein
MENADGSSGKKSDGLENHVFRPQKICNISNSINKGWHRKHPMPKKPTLDQRLDRHVRHHKKYNCLEIPNSIKLEIGKGKIKI